MGRGTQGTQRKPMVSFEDAARERGPLTVYVPAQGSPLASLIAPRSGIVGTPVPQWGVLIDYEGAVHGQQDLRSYAARLHHAAGRHIQEYPTVARMSASADELVPVGEWDALDRSLTVTNEPELLIWLGQDELRLSDREMPPSPLAPAEVSRMVQRGDLRTLQAYAARMQAHDSEPA